jgi:peptidoglycan/LPS O-acetylase OafA/YrhL
VSRPSTEPRAATRFRVDVQGLRALAVLLVLVYHAGLPFLPGGFVGVDIFFVISGFLITSQLIRGIREHGRVDLVDFYGRRARRILPAALLALVGTVSLTLAILPRSRWDAIATEATGSVFFVVNWIFGQSSTDYLRQDEAASPLQHYWSLAVEEQFYLLWPLMLILVLFLARRLHARQDRHGGGPARPGPGASLAVLQRRLIVGAALVLFVLSLLHSMHLTTADPGIAYFATTTRIHELAVGVLLALFATQLANLPHSLAVLLGWLGLAAMIGAGVGFSGATWFPGASALVPTLGAAAVIVSGLGGRDRSGANAVLSVRPLTWIGDISYSLYLWHWPLIVMATYLFDGLPWHVGVLTAALSVLPAWASYRWVEKPFQRWSYVKPAWKAIQVGLAASLVVIVGTVSLGVYSSRPAAEATGWEQPTYQKALQRAQSDEQAARVGGELLQRDAAAALAQGPPDGLLPGVQDVEDDKAEVYGRECVQGRTDAEPLACTFGPDDADFRVALIGDSHAAHWLPAVNRLAAENGWQVQAFLKTSCPMTTGRVMMEDAVFRECAQWNAAVSEEVGSGGFDLVLTSSSHYEAPEGESVADGFADAWSRYGEEGLRVGVIIDPPLPGRAVNECIETAPETYVEECAFEAAESPRSGSADQEQALEATSSATPVDLTAGICPGGTCPPVIGNVIVWRDSNHLTATYAASMAPWLGEVLIEQELVPGS